MADTIRKQAFTQIASPKLLRERQQKIVKEEPAAIRYFKSYNKARIHSDTQDELSIPNLERKMVRHKFDHATYEPEFLHESNRSAMIAILSKEQDVR